MKHRIQKGGSSYIRKNMIDGKIYKQIDLEDKYFGEGITF
jgi:glutamine cyclotransferase